MTDDRDDIKPEDAVPEHEDRPDPRLRPPDPAGTQPKWDPDALLPKRKPPAASGRLWAPGSEEDDEADGERLVAASVTEGATAGAADAAPADAAGSGERRYSKYSGRFQFLLGALLALGTAAVALLVAAIVGSSDNNKTITLSTGPAWSAWRPTATNGSDAAEQIAEHVGKQYRLPNGQQLVMATGGPMEVAGLPVTVAIQESAAQGGDINFVPGTGVLYRLCGIGGTDCKIAYGRPSANRMLLLKREALELALYSFRYLGVTQAVVLLPPSQVTDKKTGKTTKNIQSALLFRRDAQGLGAALSHPLNATLSTRTPSVNAVTRSPDALAVRSLTLSNLFNFRFQESNQDARAFLVLSAG